MSKERKILGRGLSALISQTQPDNSELKVNNEEDVNKIYDVNINKILPNTNQPRKYFSEQEINELAKSISEHGLLQPILVTKLQDDNYELIAGERRLQAAKKAGMKEISVIIKEIDETKSFEYAITENIQRQDLNPLEEARAYQKLIDKHGYTHERLALKLGKSRSYISNILRILNLSDDIKILIEKNKISFGHARALLNVENPSELIPQILDKKLSVRNVEKIAKKQSAHINGKSKKQVNNYYYGNDNYSQAQAEGNEDIKAIESMLKQTLGLSVRVISTDNGGQIQINFENLDELDSIVQVLGSKGLNF